MNSFRNVAISLTLLTAGAAGCGPTDPTADEPVIIVTGNNGSAQNNGQTTADGNNGTAANNGGTTGTNQNTNSVNNGQTNNETTGTNNETTSTNNETTGPDDPCGNGVIDAGEVCDGDCPTSCDDGDPCTTDTMTGSPDMCTAVCANEVNSACDAWAGNYSGTYFISAEEKVGSSVINSMTCTGTFDAQIDPDAADPITGTAECDYPGSLTIFDSVHTATMTGKVNPDGTISLRISHDGGSPSNGTFNVDGTVAQGTLVVDDTSSWRPHPQGAVAWEVVVQLN